MVAARSKLNLCLRVTGQRIDGYHELESVVTFTELADQLSFTDSDRLSLTVSGPFAARVPVEGNLILRAAEKLRQSCGINKGAHIVLEKHIPVEAGLGGGSSDAAMTLVELSRLWDVTLPKGRLQEIALSLGADVPVCAFNQPAFITGIGEKMEPLKGLPSYPVVLVNPMIPLSTVNVFKRGFPHFSMSIGESYPSKPEAWLEFLRKQANDLEMNAKSLVPEIWQVLDMLSSFTGCQLSRMSGSGATCFAIFALQEQAEEAARIIGEETPGWWTHATRTAPSN